MIGIIGIDKPSGVTSHDVVDFVRDLTGEERVGHCGTLDPLATGLLPMCIGAATRLAEFLSASTKVYRVEATLAVVTDTGDVTGRVLARHPGPWPAVSRVAGAVEALVGPRRQRPPAYSAVRVRGRRLHELARAGLRVKAPERTIVVERAVFEGYDPPHVVFTLTCSKGTYVRALVEDLAADLCTGGAVVALRRIASGGLCADDAHTTFTVAAAAVRGEFERLMVPWYRALPGHRVLTAPPGGPLSRLMCGAPVELDDGWAAPDGDGIDLAEDARVLVLDQGGRPLAASRVETRAGRRVLVPVKVLAERGR